MIGQLHGRLDGKGDQKYGIRDFKDPRDILVVFHKIKSGNSHHESVETYQHNNRVLYHGVIDQIATDFSEFPQGTQVLVTRLLIAADLAIFCSIAAWHRILPRTTRIARQTAPVRYNLDRSHIIVIVVREAAVVVGQGWQTVHVSRRDCAGGMLEHIQYGSLLELRQGQAYTPLAPRRRILICSLRLPFLRRIVLLWVLYHPGTELLVDFVADFVGGLGKEGGG